jgi:hypothetical protein
MSGKPQACFLCEGPATIGPLHAPNGGLMASTLIVCGTCKQYVVPKSVDLEELKALHPEGKRWLASEIRKQFRDDPSNPFAVSEGAILMARSKR